MSSDALGKHSIKVELVSRNRAQYGIKSFMKEHFYALSFYRSKIILFNRIVLGRSRAMKWLFSTEFCFLIHAQKNLDRSQIDLDQPKTIWMSPKLFWIYRRTRHQFHGKVFMKWLVKAGCFCELDSVQTSWRTLLLSA